jgi:hypothetical protein
VYRTFTKTLKGKNDKMKICAFCSSLSIIHFQDYNTGNNFYILGGKGSGQDGRVKEGGRGGGREQGGIFSIPSLTLAHSKGHK